MRIVEDALRTMVDGYFVALAKQRKSRIDDPSIDADRAMFVEHVREVLGVRGRLVAAINKGVPLVTTEGHKLEPQFMPRDLLETARWSVWEGKIYPLLDRLTQLAG